MDLSGVLLPVATLVLGAGTTHLLEGRRYRRHLADDVARALLEQRSEAYRQFMRDAHATAEAVGRSAAGCPEPHPDPIEALTLLDRDVVRDLYELELLAGESVLTTARRVRRALREFRESVRGGASHKDDAYEAALEPYRAARAEFLAEAREELLRGSNRRPQR